ncbi:MAG: lipoprotein [bacterium]|nr:lipoprotein [bacterium]
MRRFLFWILALFLLSGCTRFSPQDPFEWNADIRWLASNNFHSLEEGRVSASAEPKGEFLRRLLVEKRVRVFVSLKGDIPESSRRLIESYGATLYTFQWSAQSVPPEKEIAQVFQLMQGGTMESPVHVFCRAGVDRTGYARAYYRYYAQGWSARHALLEMYSFFHLPNALDRDLKERFKKFPNNRPVL